MSEDSRPDEDVDRQRKRLMRENHLLRLQILKMQTERREAFRRNRNANKDDNITNVVKVPSTSDAEQNALQLRIRTLQKQNEREKVRRATSERELRYEIELLRLALDEVQSGVKRRKSNDDDSDVESASSSRETIFSDAPVKRKDSAQLTAYEREMQRTQQLYEESIRKYEAERGSFFPKDEIADDNPLGNKGSSHLPTDDLLQQTANRRKLRQLRLEKLGSSSGDSTTVIPDLEHTPNKLPSHTDPNESIGALPAPFIRPRFNSHYPTTAPVMPLGSEKPNVVTYEDEEEEEEEDPFSQTHHTGTSIVNPNQIGVEIRDDEKNRSWYLQKALCTAMLQFFPHVKRTRSVIQSTTEGHETNVVVTGINSSNATTEGDSNLNRSTASSAIREKGSNLPNSLLPDLEHDQTVLSETTDSENETDSHRGKEEMSTPLTTPTSTNNNSNFAARKSEQNTPVRGKAKSSETGEHSLNQSVVEPQKAFMYKGQNPVALQRAIEESFSLHCRCAHDEPVLTSWREAETQTYPAFEDENSDLGLICAFSTEADAELRARDKKKKNHKASKKSPVACREDEVRVILHSPVVFSQIRDFLQLDVGNFRHSLEKAPWRQSMSPGKSGSILYYFGNYVMKTVHESEFQFFVNRYLPSYVQYCEQNPHTLLPKFYALITLKWLKLGITKRFVLMHNVFCTRYYIHRIYDVKGSTVGRTALKPGKPVPRTAFGALLLKDNDLPSQLIICGSYQRAIMLAQLRSDVDFLHSLNIVDYSCMIGVRSRVFSREEGPSQTIFLRKKKKTDKSDYEKHSNFNNVIEEHATTLTNLEKEGGADVLEVGTSEGNVDGYICIHGCDGGLLSLPIYAPGDDTTAREDVYYLGIIDVLQEYNSVKKFENFAKGFVNDRRQISVIPPKEYSERLYRTLERITI